MLETVRAGDTHEVANQPPVLAGYDAFGRDRVLQEAVERHGAGWARERLSRLGRVVANASTEELARAANRNEPELRTHDRFGHRIDAVEFHPAYHELMRLAFAHEVHSLAWTAAAGGHVARTALAFLWNQAESGVACPVSMTYAAVASVRAAPDLSATWEPALLSNAYDPRPIPIALKTGATMGMAMTEKQGGSDLRSTETRAYATGRDGAYELTGHKWFCSAPMSDAFLTLARTEDGVTCFLVPRSLPDGSRNRFLIQRLKDKCGNRSNASAEIEYRETSGWLVGEPGGGIRTILAMGHLTRLETALASAALMRRAFVEARHHVAHRRAFGKVLIEQPLMRNVVADLALESEAATALVVRLAAALDASETSEGERLLARLGVPVAKYWICKRTPPLVAEAMECLGGNGFVEDAPLARLYREAPLNGIWEGSGNVICFDVLRVLKREPASLAALVTELRTANGTNRVYDGAVASLESELTRVRNEDALGRIAVEHIALTLQASLLLRYAPAAVADAFCSSRLGHEAGRAFGTLPSTAAHGAIVERAWMHA